MRLNIERKHLLLLFAALIVSSAAHLGSSEESVEASFEKTDPHIELEIADTPEERAEGLMNRSELEENRGMIFVYEEEDDRRFWMKNTYIPLDIIFLDSNMTVINIEEADPQPDVSDSDLRRYRSEEPAQYVVELNQGFTDNHSIDPGDKLVLERKLVK